MLELTKKERKILAIAHNFGEVNYTSCEYIGEDSTTIEEKFKNLCLMGYLQNKHNTFFITDLGTKELINATIIP